MTKSEMIRARVEPELKQEAETVFSKLGLSVTQAITLFYKQVTLQQGLPFAVKIPNAETREALQNAYDGEDLTEYESLDALKAAPPSSSRAHPGRTATSKASMPGCATSS